ncbi:hypothetical protein APSETT444_010618 [Aspergillus pseudonomiae]
MAPNLRSSSHVRSNDSRPSTPLHAPDDASPASSFNESTRPRKQRRTGRHSRVATDPPHETPSQNQSQLGQFKTGISDTVSDSQLSEKGAEWVEPPVRAPAPSYRDTPWSAVSSDNNPVLATMRPLGTMPSAADMRKAGLGPLKPSTQNTTTKKDQRPVQNGDKEISKPQTPLTPAEEPIPEPVIPKDNTAQDVTAFTTLPVPNSTDVDVVKLRSAVENALHMASETGNRPVIRGLLRLWETCGKDSFALSVLEGVCGANPGAREQSVFQTVMRTAWKEVQSEENTEVLPTVAPAMGRTRSASSVSSLSSAKSLDVETFAPGMAPGAANARSRGRGKHSKSTQKAVDSEASEPPSRRSVFPSSDTTLQRRRALEENPEFSAEAVKAKRTRLQRSFPKITATESRLRSSLASEPPSGVTTPSATTAGQPQTAAEGTVAEQRERSESPASSDAGDNRRLTPTMAVNRENAIPPAQKPGSDRTYHSWMCPDHSWHDKFFIVQDEEGYDLVKRVRRPKNPRLIDVEILPDEEEDEKIEEQEEEGIMYRVSEKGIKLDFIQRVKRENEELAMKKAAADKYYEYVRQRHDELTSKAHALYAAQNPEVIEEDTTTAILNSRTAAEREAAANLITFAQGNSTEVEDSKIGLLIDQLKANVSPDFMPSAESEIASLRSLQRLIELRITDLRTQSAPAESSAVNSPDVEHMDAQPTNPSAST